MINLLVDASSYEGVSRVAIIFQSIYDLVPIAFFLLAAIILLRALYNKMVKGAYVLFASGSIMIFVAGLLKALHKFLIGAAQIDYVILDKQFTSTQSLGFLLIFLSLVGMFTKYNKNFTRVRVSIIPLLIPFLAIVPFESSLPFIAIMVIGALGMLSMLIYMSIRLKTYKAIIFFAIAIVSMLGMGYLSTKADFSMAWIQISINLLYQGGLLVGVLFLKKAGLDKEECFYKE